MKPGRVRSYRFSLRVLMVFVAIAAVAASRYKTPTYRSVVAWAKTRADNADRLGYRALFHAVYSPSPIGCSSEEILYLLEDAIRREKRTDVRAACLKVIVEDYPEAAYQTLNRCDRWLQREDLLILTIRLRCIHRRAADLRMLSRHLHHESPSVRAAAADAIGIINKPPHPIPLTGHPDQQSVLLCDPIFIDLQPLLKHLKQSGQFPTEVDWRSDNRGTKQHREGLLATIREGPTVEEREAAARALVAWPKEDERSRVVEFGVWNLPGTCGTFEMFPVGRLMPVANSAVSAECRTVSSMLMIRSPSDATLDVEFLVRDGEAVVSNLKVDTAIPEWFNPGRLPRLTPSFQFQEGDFSGYPWILPSRRQFLGIDPFLGVSRPDPLGWSLYSLGGRWQNLYLTRDRRSWMRLQSQESKNYVVRPDGNAVPFLSFCGVTHLPLPISVSLNGDRLTMKERVPRTAFRLLPGETRLDVQPPKRFRRDDETTTQSPRAFFLVVNDGRANEFRFGHLEPIHHIKALTRIPPGEIQAAFVKELAARGVDAEEAELVWTTWGDTLFKSQQIGVRAVLLLGQVDQDRIAPLLVRPEPLHRIRVGALVIPIKNGAEISSEVSLSENSR